MNEALLPNHILSNIEACNPWDLFTIQLAENDGPDPDDEILNDLEEELCHS